MKHNTIYSAVLLLAVAFAAGACKKKTESIEELDTDDTKPAVDPALAEAVAAASASAAPSAGSPDQEGGPPPNGVFPPGQADQELTRGAPPKITLGGEGSAPRVKLTGLPPIGKHELRVRFVQISAGRGLPLDLQLALEVDNPQAKEGEQTTPVGGRTVVATIESAKVDVARVAQQVPKETEADVAKLKGSKVTFALDALGTGRDFAVEASKAAGGQRNDLLSSLGGLLATITVPVPDKPVGKGALWMATTRETVLGIDTLSYRLIKVEEFEGTKATLKIDTKRYAADARQVVPTLAEDGAVEFQAFQAEGTGFVTVPTTGGFPIEGKITRGLKALLIVSSRGAQPVMMQERVEGAFEGLTSSTEAESAAQPTPAGVTQPPAAPAQPPAPAPAGQP